MRVTRKAAYMAAAKDGFEGKEFSGLYTSTRHACYCVGQWLQESGRSAPRDIRPSRGDLMRCNDMLLRIDWNHSYKYPTITREC